MDASILRRATGHGSAPKSDSAQRAFRRVINAIAAAVVVATISRPALAEAIQWPAGSLLVGSPGTGYNVLTYSPLYLGEEYHWGSDTYHWSLRSAEAPSTPGRHWAEFTDAGPNTFETQLDVTLQTQHPQDGLHNVHLVAGNDGYAWEGSVAPHLSISVPQLGLSHQIDGASNFSWNQQLFEGLGWSFDAGGLSSVHILIDYRVSGGCYTPDYLNGGVCAYVDTAGFSLGAQLGAAAVVPLPAAAVLICGPLAGLGLLRRRRIN